jgi:hypothetical protein
VRVLVVLVGLAAPYLAGSIAPLMRPLASRIQALPVESRNREKREHLEFLQTYMSEGRSVIFVSSPYVVVEGGYSLALFGLRIPREKSDAARSDLEARLTGRKITATFPPEFMLGYNPNTRNAVTSPYARGKARRFGDAPALVDLDGAAVIPEMNRRWARPKVR